MLVTGLVESDLYFQGCVWVEILQCWVGWWWGGWRWRVDLHCISKMKFTSSNTRLSLLHTYSPCPMNALDIILLSPQQSLHVGQIPVQLIISIRRFRCTSAACTTHKKFTQKARISIAYSSTSIRPSLNSAVRNRHIYHKSCVPIDLPWQLVARLYLDRLIRPRELLIDALHVR